MTPAPAKKPAAAKSAARVSRAAPHTTATVFTDRRIALLVAFLALIVGALAAATVANAVDTASNGDLLESHNKLLHIIEDSVEPSGRRFQEGQARTATAVSAINEISVLAAHCAHKHADVVAIQVCVEVEYRRMHPPTPTTTVAPPRS